MELMWLRVLPLDSGMNRLNHGIRQNPDKHDPDGFIRSCQSASSMYMPSKNTTSTLTHFPHAAGSSMHAQLDRCMNRSRGSPRVSDDEVCDCPDAKRWLPFWGCLEVRGEAEAHRGRADLRRRRACGGHRSGRDRRRTPRCTAAWAPAQGPPVAAPHTPSPCPRAR